MSGTEWLSKGGEQLAWEILAKSLADDEVHYDVVIVGSGYGGSVAAARLAGSTSGSRPLTVCLLERGREYVPGSFPERFAEMPAYVRVSRADDPNPKGQRDGLFDFRLGSDVSAVVGNGLGGGSLINAGVLAEPAEEVFVDNWPAALRGRVLSTHFEKARLMLGGSKIPLAPGKPAKLAALEAVGHALTGESADRRANVAVTFDSGTSAGGVLQEPCIGCGDCFTGCNYWSKNTLPMNYLALAWQRGAKIFTGLTVLEVCPLDSGARWALRLVFTDPKVAHRYKTRCGGGNDPFQLIARKVVLAAGTFGSTEILLRSQKNGLDVSKQQLGKHFSANGDMLAAGHRLHVPVNACGREQDAPGARGVGPTITGMIDLRKAPDDRYKGIVIEELAIPSALRRPFEEIVTTAMALRELATADWTRHWREATGPDTGAVDPEAIAHTAIYATMGRDDAGGAIELIGSASAPTDGAVKVTWEDVVTQDVFKRGIRALEAAHAYPLVGGTVIASPLWQPLPDQLAAVLDTQPLGGTIFTVHPLGGCVMADSPNEGVVNHLGQVFRQSGTPYENLVVLDGSVVPTALGINPCLTIAALAEYAIEGLAGPAHWNLKLQGSSCSPLPRPGNTGGRPRAEPPDPHPTQLRIAERMRSNDGEPGWSLTVEFDPIPDLLAFVADSRKVLAVDKAWLQIGAAPRINLRGHVCVLERDGAGWLRRVVRAFWAWVWNRGARDVWRHFFGRDTKEEKKKPSIWSMVGSLFRLASRAGEVRRLVYDLVVVDGGSIGGRRRLAVGDRLQGEKVLAYRWGSDPWTQFTRLPLYHVRAGWRRRRKLKVLHADLPFFVRDHWSTFQFTSQADQPTAIADLISFGAYLARLIGRIHIWTFRAPEYPSPYPKYPFDGNDQAPSRLPGSVAGIQPKVTPLRVGQGSGRKQIEILLSRYCPSKPNEWGPVVLFHGLGASGNTFTLNTVPVSLAAHLLRLGFDTWVVDLRTSIGLRSSEQQWRFEDVAHDVVAAVGHVFEETGRPVNVVAHCIGAAMFCMAALSGKLEKEWVRAAVLSQVGPLLDMPQWNVLRGYLAGYLKYYVQVKDLNVTAPPSPAHDFVDRLLSALPVPLREWLTHHPLAPWATIPHEAFCNRITGIYGQLYNHANMGRATLERLGDFIGHINFLTFLQTVFYATEGRLTDFVGRNCYVTPQNISDHLRFPICFVHGEQNQVFDPDTSRESIRLLAEVLCSSGLEVPSADSPLRNVDKLFQGGRHLRLEVIPGYGHQDCMIGSNAAADVFPRISGFIEQDFRGVTLADPDWKAVVRSPKLGPVLGWLWTGSSAGGATGGPAASITFVPDDRCSPPRYGLSIVCRDGRSVPGWTRLHRLGKPTAGAHTLHVDLPPGWSNYEIMVASVHYEPSKAIDPPTAVVVDDHLVADPYPGGLPLTTFVTDRADELGHCVFQAKKRLGFVTGRMRVKLRVTDEEYPYAPDMVEISMVEISDDCLEAADTGDRREPSGSHQESRELTFAVSSCRYASAVLDRELADRSFGRLRHLLDNLPAGRSRPQLQFLVGDQIYADATAGNFDPTNGVERFDKRYEEVWGAPNARDVLRRLPTYMMLDDHEVDDDWEVDAPYRDEGLAAFEAFQRNSAPTNPLGATGAPNRRVRYWYKLRAAGYGFFVADTRTERCLTATPKPLDMDATIMSEEQASKLEHWLSAEEARSGGGPKFVVSPSVVAPWFREHRGALPYALRSDSWDGFPRSVNRLLSYIACHRIQNVIFLCGDYHCSLLTKLTLSIANSGQPPVTAYSIVSSGLYIPYPFTNTSPEELELRFAGRHLAWLGVPGTRPPNYNAGLTIEWVTHAVVRPDNYVVVTVEPKGATRWSMTVDFDAQAQLERRTVELYAAAAPPPSAAVPAVPVGVP